MTQSLQMLLEHAERERDAARSALQQAEQAHERLALQAAQLREYRAEYLARGPGRDGRAAPIALLRCHQDFLQRLDQAVAQLQRQQDSAEQRVQQLREALLAHEQRVASVRKLLERRDAEQRRGAARQEQRRQDDAAQRSAARRGEGDGPLARLWGGDALPVTH
jgi:flagellar FliJ protein